MNSALPSIRRRLLTALIGTLLVVWLVVVLLVYRAAEHEVEEVFDADLARSAETLQTLLQHEVEEEDEMSEKLARVQSELGSDGLRRYPVLGSILADLQGEEASERLELVRRAQSAGHGYESGLIVVARYADGSIMLRDAVAPELPLTTAGFVDIDLDGMSWRVYRLTDAQSGLTVQVGERHAFRDELIRYITRNTLMPLLVALPVLAMLIWIVVGRALAPLQRLTHGISRRDPAALEPIDEGNAPREIHGLVQALNTLFRRMRAALDRERQFTSDAAHELRTPLAAVKAHLQVAQTDVADPRAAGSIDQALKGVDRATHTVEQLLLLARADSEQERERIATPVDLRELAIEGVGALSQAAVERHIDLGIEAQDGLSVRGDRAALQVMLRNLIDNAIRYTPEGGSVTVVVSADDHDSWLRVSDSGPGIPAADHQRVFDRFYRGEGEQAAGTTGSGLGLAIVQRIARLHDARIELGPGLGRAGLGVTVRFKSAYQ
jgi:two-component system sensor histidine kinase QseC